jgi:hypothetical protein
MLPHKLLLALKVVVLEATVLVRNKVLVLKPPDALIVLAPSKVRILQVVMQLRLLPMLPRRLLPLALLRKLQ